MPGTQLEIWKFIVLAIAPLLGVLAAKLRHKERPRIQDVVAGLAGGAFGVTASLLTVIYGRNLFAFLYRTLGRFSAQASVACARLGRRGRSPPAQAKEPVFVWNNRSRVRGRLRR